MSPTTTRAKKKAAADKPEPLPRAPQVGDRIRLKSDRTHAYQVACDAAGYARFVPDEVHVVIREDRFAPGGGRRLFVEHEPFCFNQSDVELLDPQTEERRERLRAKGWNV